MARLRTVIATAATTIALTPAPASAATVSLDEIERPDGSRVLKLFVNAAQSYGEVNRLEVVIGPGNLVRATDVARLEAEGKCGYETPARTAVLCPGNPALPVDAATVDLGGGDDRLVVSTYGGASPTLSVQSGPGNDVVTAGPGADTLYGSAGDDVLAGGPGADTVFGQGGNDRLYGGAGNDRLEGGLGHDRLFGGLGNDFLLGALGDDLLFGGPGVDRTVGGEGRDRADGRPLP